MQIAENIAKIEFYPFSTDPEPLNGVDLTTARQTCLAGMKCLTPALISASAGCGKTTTAIKNKLKRLVIAEVAKEEKEELIVFLTPTTKLAQEVEQKARSVALEAGIDTDIRRYEPRTEGSCIQFKMCKKVRKWGYSEYILVCQTCHNLKKCAHLTQLKDENASNDEGSKRPYIKKGFLVATHAASDYLMETLDVDHVIFDESPLSSLIRTERVEFGEMMRIISRTDFYAKMMAAIGKLQDNLQRLNIPNNLNFHESYYGRLNATTSKLEVEEWIELEKQNQKRIKENKLAQSLKNKKENTKETKTRNKKESESVQYLLMPVRKEEPSVLWKESIDKQNVKKEKESKTKDKNNDEKVEVRVAPDAWEGKSLSLYEYAGITIGDRDEVIEHMSILTRHEDENESEAAWQKKLLKYRIKYKEFEWLQLALGIKGQGIAYIDVRAMLEKRSACLKMVINRAPDFSSKKHAKTRLTDLDATADKEEADSLFRCNFTQFSAKITPPQSRRVHILQNLGNTAAKKIKKNTERLEEYLAEAIYYLKQGDKKVFLLTHKIIEKPLLEIAKRIAPDKEWMSGYHWASRGLNCYENCDAAIVIGTPYASPEGVIDQGFALFGNNPEKILKWTHNLGRRDLIQGINRIRPMLEGKTIIVLGSFFPTEEFGKPSRTIDKQRKGGVERQMWETINYLVPVAEQYCCLTEEIAEKHGVFEDSDRLLDGDFKTMHTYRKKDWRTILKIISERTGIPLIEHFRSGSRSTGKMALGSFDVVKSHYEFSGLPFEAAQWRIPKIELPAM
jgi:hypothetical protein